MRPTLGSDVVGTPKRAGVLEDNEQERERETTRKKAETEQYRVGKETT